MSNLYKQQFIVPESKGARIINSNTLIQQKVEEQAKALLPVQEPDESGFVEGINAVEVEEIDYAAQAEEEAEQIVNDAKVQAEKFLSDAESQVQQRREQAEEEGRQEGYAVGMQETEQLLAKKSEELMQQKQRMEEDYRRQEERLESELLHVIVEVVEKVFHVQFHDKEKIMLRLVKNTVESIDGAREFVIKADAAHAGMLEEHKQEILDCIGQNMAIDIVTDHSLDEGECVIETDTGLFECGPDTQMKNLIKDIKSLCL